MTPAAPRRSSVSTSESVVIGGAVFVFVSANTERVASEPSQTSGSLASVVLETEYTFCAAGPL